MSIYAGLGAGEEGNPEVPVGTDKKSPYKSQLSLGKGRGKGQPETENFQIKTALQQPNTTKKREDLVRHHNCRP